MPLEDIWQRIETGYKNFSPQLRRAAHFVRSHPQDVALRSLRGCAGLAGVSPASMTRLIQALDFDSWDAFQAEHRAWLTGERPGVFSRRADRLVRKARKPGAEDALLDAIIVTEQENLSAALGRTSRYELKEATNMLASASGIAIVGIRSCFPVAFSLHYSLSLFLRGVRLMTGTGGALHDDLHFLRADDVLVVISVSPYSRETVEVARLARDAGVRIVAITDGPLTPVALLADITLVAPNDSPAHIATPIGPIAVAQALASLVLARSGDDALEILRHREATLEAIFAYLPEEKTQ